MANITDELPAHDAQAIRFEKTASPAVGSIAAARRERLASAIRFTRPTRMLKGLVKNGLEVADNFFVSVDPGRAPKSGSLVTVLFHSLCKDQAQIGDRLLAPNLEVTVADFRRFVEVMLEYGYTVVSPAQVDAGLKPGGKYLMITFDDGYFNNTLALDVLDQFHVPAVFHVSTDHVLENKAFWWDGFSRELDRSGASLCEQDAEIRRIKVSSPGKIEELLRARYGASVLAPRSDLDRPFTPAELKHFARNQWVHLGNHTCDHVILTNATSQEVARQIQGCQEALADMAGQTPITVAYPNGNYSRAVVEASLAAGLRIGFTCLPHRTRLPLDGNKSRMTLGRFNFWGGRDICQQCRKFGSSFIPTHMLKTLIGSRLSAP
jgi:peptidoglycan/xylan/chitin deacetylase (PgdA/CDA1 family)